MKDGSIYDYLEGPMIKNLSKFGQPTYDQLWNATIALGKLMNEIPLGEVDVESAALAYVWVGNLNAQGTVMLTEAVHR